MDPKELFARRDRFTRLTDDVPADRPGIRTVATNSHATIHVWATSHHAEPATGEATASGPATISVNDGGAGIRFNFPGVAPYRPISWDEWFDHFDQHDLLFVYEEEDTDKVAERAYELWKQRPADSDDRVADWLEAENAVRRETSPRAPMLRYRIVKNRREAGK